MRLYYLDILSRRAMKRLLLMAVLLIIISQVEAAPQGIGSIGDNGCVCHGGSKENTTVALFGLPEVYNSSQVYNLTLSIDSPLEKNNPQGGFRILVSHGEIVGDVQELEDGYTHSESTNNRRVWEFNWTAPDSDTEMVTFIVHGNAVNGNGEPSGDEWNSNSYAVPGTNYTGEVNAPAVDGSVSPEQLVVGAIGVFAVLALAVIAIKD